MKINVVVKSSAKENKIEKGLFDNSYVIYTKEPAIDNRANMSIIQIISKELNVRKGDIKIVKGLRSKYKVIEIKIEN